MCLASAADPRMSANPLREATLAARKVDPNIATRVEGGMFTIVRAVPRKDRSHDVTVLAGPMKGWQAVESLERFAKGGAL